MREGNGGSLQIIECHPEVVATTAQKSKDEELCHSEGFSPKNLTDNAERSVYDPSTPLRSAQDDTDICNVMLPF